MKRLVLIQRLRKQPLRFLHGLSRIPAPTIAIVLVSDEDSTIRLGRRVESPGEFAVMNHFCYLTDLGSLVMGLRPRFVAFQITSALTVVVVSSP